MQFPVILLLTFFPFLSLFKRVFKGERYNEKVGFFVVTGLMRRAPRLCPGCCAILNLICCHLSTQADVFSFAMVCYEMIHRRLILTGIMEKNMGLGPKVRAGNKEERLWGCLVVLCVVL